MVKEGLKKNPKFGWFLNNGFASDRDLGLCGRGQGWDDLARTLVAGNPTGQVKGGAGLVPMVCMSQTSCHLSRCTNLHSGSHIAGHFDDLSQPRHTFTSKTFL